MPRTLPDRPARLRAGASFVLAATLTAAMIVAAPSTTAHADISIPGPVRDYGKPQQSIVAGTVTVRDFPVSDWRADSVDAELYVYNAKRRAWITTGRVDLIPPTGQYSFDGLERQRYRLVFTNWQGAGFPRFVTPAFTPDRATVTIDATIDAHHDASGDGVPDIIARDAKGVVWIYRGTGDGQLGTRVRAASGLGSMTAILAAGDLDSNGVADLLARDRAGALWLYRANGSGSFGSRLLVGSGFADATAIVSAGDVTGDLRPDVLTRDAEGLLWLHEGTGLSGFYSPTLVGAGWNAWTSITGAGDLTGDGRDDLMTLDAAGAVWLLAGSGNGAFDAPTLLDDGWGAVTALMGAGDFTGDGLDDLVTRDAAGALWVHAGDRAGGIQPGLRFATGFAKLTLAG